MDIRRRGLGRGLGALIPGSVQTAPKLGLEVESWANITAISLNPFSSRRVRRCGAVRADGIDPRKGLLQRSWRRADNGRYQLIAGERRFRAAQRAGLNAFRSSCARPTTARHWNWR